MVDFEEKEYIENIDIQWEITQKCNLSCAHCIANAMITKTEESYDDIKKIADKILMLEDGSISAAGTHEQLLSSSQTYLDMWKAHISAMDWSMNKEVEILC